LSAFSSVITLTEVLSKPFEARDEKLASKFANFLKHGKNLSLIEISTSIAERAGILRGRYPDIKALMLFRFQQLLMWVQISLSLMTKNSSRYQK
jgi:hypothetical protein